MLNDDEKQCIAEEEIFRDKIRRELANKPNSSSWRDRMWPLLNSAFALWFLSTVAVGSATWMYSKWEKKRAVTLKNVEIARKLKNEVGLRLWLFADALSAVKKRDYDFESYSTALSLLNRPSFPEIGPRSLGSLAWEIYSVAPDEEEKKAYAKAFDYFHRLERLDLAKSPVMSKAEIAENVREIYDGLNMLIMARAFTMPTPIVIERLESPPKQLKPPEGFHMNPQETRPGKKTD